MTLSPNFAGLARHLVQPEPLDFRRRGSTSRPGSGQWTDDCQCDKQYDDFKLIDESVSNGRTRQRLAEPALHSETVDDVPQATAEGDAGADGRGLDGAPRAEHQAVVAAAAHSHRSGQRADREQAAAEADQRG